MTRRWLLSCAFLAATLCAALPAQAVVPTQERPFVVLRALDKMTARVEEMTLPVGKTFQFGSLSILARTCRVTLPEEAPPESAAYLEIYEFKPGAQEQTSVFDGWMFASSPALSAMEHPVYDIWVTGCADKAASN
ncbi:MAG: DUF2155 domain-containing protein [Alphaproteobacteria bacterium]|nr:DUF2155 domain-containing protein [Alphaproteobacteria bacterium]